MEFSFKAFKRNKRQVIRRTRFILAAAVAGAISMGTAPSIYGQTPSWQWAKGAGSATCSPTVNGVVIDATGNIYVTGSFVGGSMTLGTINIPPADAASNTVFVAKYNKEGVIQWAKSCQQGHNANSAGIAIDGTGNVMIAGSFMSWIKFGSTTLTSGGDLDIFIAKFNPSGDVLWAKKAGSPETDEAMGIAADNSGNVVITGAFTGTNTITFDTKTLSASGEYNPYITKYDANGNAQWVKGCTTTGVAAGRAVTIDATGNIYQAGMYQNTTLTVGTTTLTNAGSSDIFIAKYAANGTVTWAKRAGGTSVDEPDDIALDGAGNIYVSGRFMGTASFETATVNATGGSDFFIAKLNSSGAAQWAKSAGGDGQELNIYIAVDNAGNVSAAGTYGFQNKSATFGTINLSNAGGTDLFIARYSTAGAVTWAKNRGNTGDDAANALAIDAGGNVFIAGNYNSPSLAFDGTTLTSPNAIYGGVYLAKYGSPVTGINGIAKLTDWNVYPNPSRGNFTIDCEEKIQAVKVINILGQVVYEKEGSATEVDLGNQPQGLYAIFIKTATGEGNKQILLRK